MTGPKQTAFAGLVVVLTVLAAAAAPARADPSQADVFRSIQSSVGNQDPISGRAVGAAVAIVGGIAIVAVVYTQRQNRREFVNGGWGSATSGGGGGRGRGRRPTDPMNNPGKLVRELMKEAGLTRAQVRQLEALNDRLAADDRSVQHLATLLLCPSLIAAAKPPQIVRGG